MLMNEIGRKRRSCGLVDHVVFVLTSLMLCYYNDKDLIFFFFSSERPEEWFEISNNAASRLECCTNKHTSKAKLNHIVVFSHSPPEFTAAAIAVVYKSQTTQLITKRRGILELYARCIFYDLLY